MVGSSETEECEEAQGAWQQRVGPVAVLPRAWVQVRSAALPPLGPGGCRQLLLPTVPEMRPSRTAVPARFLLDDREYRGGASAPALHHVARGSPRPRGWVSLGSWYPEWLPIGIPECLGSARSSSGSIRPAASPAARECLESFPSGRRLPCRRLAPWLPGGMWLQLLPERPGRTLLVLPPAGSRPWIHPLGECCDLPLPPCETPSSSGRGEAPRRECRRS